jgi:hypothetical protein
MRRDFVTGQVQWLPSSDLKNIEYECVSLWDPYVWVLQNSFLSPMNQPN